MNDKIDLAQAEAIADLIDASTEAAARSASRSLSGDFSREIGELREALVHLRMLVEATLDFPGKRSTSCKRPMPTVSWTRCATNWAKCWRAPSRARCCAKASRW